MSFHTQWSGQQFGLVCFSGYTALKIATHWIRYAWQHRPQ